MEEGEGGLGATPEGRRLCTNEVTERDKEEGGGTRFVHGCSRMTIAPHTLAMPRKGEGGGRGVWRDFCVGALFSAFLTGGGWSGGRGFGVYVAPVLFCRLFVAWKGGEGLWEVYLEVGSVVVVMCDGVARTDACSSGIVGGCGSCFKMS